ncbi:NAD(P)H-dependent oxidoreductase [Thiomicrorhabdus sp. 6S3-12]|uniref:NAD(P)H-dependent oxidoreductase n=1 Tax=Thiomicrorhabdus sp. 6S3-12 TaxID=2819681 RepID=UPI001AADAD3F|nr:NAD(P)H-dependent oxidoreductase [Thiomicrorhabdus sp. 6S3-12]MBO1924820.1 NAD(P)H-dependent oxidoreductase [Thiomicrorhabdus sp. 6S3-12]
MSKKIAIIQGHPDPSESHLNYSLAEAYKAGAEAAGHEVKVITVAKLSFALLTSEEEFDKHPPVTDIQGAQDIIKWAEHIVIFYPLWLGTMPAILKGFWEQVLRPGYALSTGDRNQWPKKLLSGRSARIVVTMGMPAFVYRWFYRAHSLKNLERNILSFSGFAPIRSTLIGAVQNLSERQRKAWLDKVYQLGQKGQ